MALLRRRKPQGQGRPRCKYSRRPHWQPRGAAFCFLLDSPAGPARKGAGQRRRLSFWRRLMVSRPKAAGGAPQQPPRSSSRPLPSLRARRAAPASAGPRPVHRNLCRPPLSWRTRAQATSCAQCPTRARAPQTRRPSARAPAPWPAGAASRTARSWAPRC